ncbi:MAG: hypothetical protein M1814_006613 [Vezdaea aestivalis]|nr:MAG: hypothetical protein M1814_006613 [Vezdaea aestivalis]
MGPTTGMDIEDPDLEKNAIGVKPQNDPKDTIPLEDMTINSVIELAAWQNDAPESAIFRRFDRLHTFNLLVLQNELRILDEQVENIRLEGEDGAEHVKITDEPDLILKIRRTLNSYTAKWAVIDEALAAQKAMTSYARPTGNIIDYIRDVCKYNASGAAQLYKIREERPKRQERKQAEKEAKRIRAITPVEELATPGPKEFEDCIDHCCPRDIGLGKIGRMLSVPGWARRKMNRNPKIASTAKYNEPELNSNLAKRWESAIINTGFGVLVLCPVVALEKVESKGKRLAFVSLFVLLTSFVVSYFADSEHKKTFATVAA